MICRFTPDGRLTLVNCAFCYFFDKSRDVLLSSNYLELQPLELREELQQNIASLSQANPLISIETVYHRRGENSSMQY